MAKTINVDRGSFLGKKDFTLEEYVGEWGSWMIQIMPLINGDTDQAAKLLDFKKWVKELAEKSFEEIYQEQQIEWVKKLNVNQ
tara:strand:+ start:36 stop:284 length:249 start_codon:yes stop_codon:yes gene_type:complete